MIETKLILKEFYLRNKSITFKLDYLKFNKLYIQII